MTDWYAMASKHLEAAGWNGTVVGQPETDPVAKAAKMVRASLAKGQRAVEAARAEVARLDADDAMNPQGRARRRAEAISAANAAAAQADRDARDALLVLRKAVESRAMPKLDPAREGYARDDLKMILGGVQSATDKAQRLVDLAKRPDLAPLIAGQWGEDYIAGLGLDDRHAEQVLKTARAAAVSAATSGDARKVFDRVGELAKAADVYGLAGHNLLEEMNETSPDAARRRALAAESAPSATT